MEIKDLKEKQEVKKSKIEQILIIALLLIILAIVTTKVVIKVKNNFEKQDEQISEEEKILVERGKKFNGFTYDKYTVVKENEENVEISLNVKNSSEEESEEQMVDIIFTNLAGEEIERITTLIPAMQPQCDTQITAAVSKDILNTYDYRIEKNAEEYSKVNETE